MMLQRLAESGKDVKMLSARGLMSCGPQSMVMDSTRDRRSRSHLLPRYHGAYAPIPAWERQQFLSGDTGPQ